MKIRFQSSPDLRTQYDTKEGSSMRALGVARVSTQEQAQGDRFSIPHQREQITQYCIQREWDLLDVVEYVHSGGSNYQELQQILARVAQEQIRVVVVNELDRLARDMISTLLFLEDLQKIGCRFVSVSDDLDLTTPDGELKMMILSVFAHYFRRQLARKVKGGLAERARQGKHHGGRPPYGFVFQGDKLEPHPEEAPVVRQIYTWYVQDGMGGRAIAKRLNEQGIPTQSGHSMWATPEVLRLLRRPANVGDLRHGELEFYTERTGVTHKRHRDDALIVRDAHPAIVNRITWDAAQRLLESRGQHSGRQGDSPYLLTGLVYCGLCGRTMVPVKARKNPRYICRGYQMSGLCTTSHAQVVDAVEQAVTADWLSRVQNPDPATIQSWVERTIERETLRSEAQREKSRIKRRLDDLPAMYQRAENALLEGAFTVEQYTTARGRLDHEAARLQQTLDALEAMPQMPPTTIEAQRLHDELAQVSERFRQAATLHQRRELIRRYVTRVELWPDEIKIYYQEQS